MIKPTGYGWSQLHICDEIQSIAIDYLLACNMWLYINTDTVEQRTQSTRCLKFPEPVFCHRIEHVSPIHSKICNEINGCDEDSISIPWRLHSSAVIMRSNIVRYYINHYRNSDRISIIKCWVYKRHPISLPKVRVMGCLLRIFARNCPR